VATILIIAIAAIAMTAAIIKQGPWPPDHPLAAILGPISRALIYGLLRHIL